MKSKMLRIVSLLLCLGMILCTVGCAGETSTTKKKKKVIVKKKYPKPSSDVSDDIDDATSDLFDYDDNDSSEAIVEDAKGEEGRIVSESEYTVNGSPLAYVTTCDTSGGSMGVKFRKQADGKVKVFDKGSAAADKYVADLLKANPKAAVMDVNPNDKKQTLKGFGASMTGSSVYNMELMEESVRDTLMTRLFDPENGIGLSILRQPIGCGDYDYLYFTYDEMPEGETDEELAYFDFSMMNKYEAYLPSSITTANGKNVVDLAVMPYINKALKLNPDITFVGSVWTAPRWMKTYYSWNTTKVNDDLVKLKNEYYDVYTNYVIKSLQAFKDQGVEFYMITPQNEPTASHGIPSTTYDANDLTKLVNYRLADAIKNAGFKTKLFAWDFNFFRDTALDIVGKQYGNIQGVAYHFYSGSNSLIKETVEMFPDLEVFLTEAAGNERGGQSGQMFRQMLNMHQSFRHGVASWILWNITLDTTTDDTKFRGPGGNNGGTISKNEVRITTDPVTGKQIFKDTIAYGDKLDMEVYGTGLTEYDPIKRSLVYQMDFYVLAHFSKFIRPGAKIIESTDLNLTNAFNYNVTALNEDGSAVVVIGNEGVSSADYIINFGDKVLVYEDLAGSSLLTIAWDANKYLS